MIPRPKMEELYLERDQIKKCPTTPLGILIKSNFWLLKERITFKRISAKRPKEKNPN